VGWASRPTTRKNPDITWKSWVDTLATVLHKDQPMNIGDLIKVTMFSKFGLPTFDGPKIGIVIDCFEVPPNMYDQTHDLTWISEGKDVEHLPVHRRQNRGC